MGIERFYRAEAWSYYQSGQVEPELVDQSDRRGNIVLTVLSALTLGLFGATFFAIVPQRIVTSIDCSGGLGTIKLPRADVHKVVLSVPGVSPWSEPIQLKSVNVNRADGFEYKLNDPSKACRTPGAISATVTLVD